MADKKRALWAPSDFMLLGATVAVVAGMIGGGLIVVAPDWIGYVVGGVIAFAGETMFTIGVIAKGVQVGRRGA